MKIFNKSLFLPPPLNFYIGDLQQGFGDDDDDDHHHHHHDVDALPVVAAVPGKAQAFYIYTHTVVLYIENSVTTILNSNIITVIIMQMNIFRIYKYITCIYVYIHPYIY